MHQQFNHLPLRGLIIRRVNGCQLFLQAVEQDAGIGHMGLIGFGQSLLGVQCRALLPQGCFLAGDGVQAGFSILQG